MTSADKRSVSSKEQVPREGGRGGGGVGQREKEDERGDSTWRG